MGTGTPRVGSFALPESGKAGTLEDVLLALGGAAYPDLAATAEAYATAWHKKVAADASHEWKELKKPAGLKKATIGAMTAVLKPGRAAQVSLEDNLWVSTSTKDHASLAPCLAFMKSLLAPVPGAPTAPASSPGTSP